MMNVCLKIASLVLVSVSSSNAATTVTVLELGRGGAVRRTTSSEDMSVTSVDGVSALWSAVHGSVDKKRRNARSSGSMVADMFHKADAGVVINLGSVTPKDVAKKIGKVVGTLAVAGAQGKHLLSRASAEVKTVAESSELASVGAVSAELQAIDVSGLKEAQKEVTAFLKKMLLEANEQQSTVVVHLVSEDSSAVSRRLAEDDDDAADDANANANNGYGYYNDYGEWVTNYRTIFQIQYFNVVLWTTVSLFVLAFASNVMLVNMPLMEDTLLFGETAKMSNQ